MKFFTIACIAAIIPTLRAQSSFQDTCNDAIAHTNSLIDVFEGISWNVRGYGSLMDQVDTSCQKAMKQLREFGELFQSMSAEYSDSPSKAKGSDNFRKIQQGTISLEGTFDSILSDRLYVPSVHRGNYAEAENQWLPDWTILKSDLQQITDWSSPPGSDSLPQVSGPQPSPTYGLSTGYGAYRRRSLGRRTLCPVTETACRISNATAAVECLDTQNEITSCGGCVSEGKGENCLEIVGAAGVGCQYGRCVVLSLAPGYKKDRRGRPVISGV